MEEITLLNVGIWDWGGGSVDRMTGIDIGLKNQVGEGRGASLGFLATVGHESLSGVALGGLASVAEGDMQGLCVAGLGTSFGGKFEGIGQGGWIMGDRAAGEFDFSLDGPTNLEHDTTANGLMLAGYRVQANHINGVAGALLMTRSHDMTGLAASAFNGVSGKPTGLSISLSIGPFNHAAEFEGVHIGLLNYVADNPRWLRWLPIVSVRF